MRLAMVENARTAQLSVRNHTLGELKDDINDTLGEVMTPYEPFAWIRLACDWFA